MFFTLTKMIQSITMGEPSVCVKGDMSNQKLQWHQVSCVTIALVKHLLVCQQLLCKYYMHVLFMKYSVYTGMPWH